MQSRALEKKKGGFQNSAFSALGVHKVIIILFFVISCWYHVFQKASYIIIYHVMHLYHEYIYISCVDEGHDI